MKNEAPAADQPEFYIWSFPGCPVRVHLSLKVVRDMNRRIRISDAKAPLDGILTGKAAGGKAIVTGFEHSEFSGEPDAIADLVRRRGESVAGYFRLDRAGGPLRLNKTDLALADCVFPQAHQVILLVQPAGTGPASATFFFRDRGKIEGSFSFLEFPFDGALLAAERETSSPTPGAAPRRRRRRWFTLWR